MKRFQGITAAVLVTLLGSLGALANERKSPERVTPSGSPGAAATPEARPTDPVCGMQVEPKKELSSAHKGKTYFFCSPEDKAKFDKAPEKYVKPESK